MQPSSQARLARVSLLALATLTSLALAGCGETNSQEASPSATSAAVTTAATGAPTESGVPSSSQETNAPEADPSATSADMPTELPQKTVDGANISVFNAEITAVEQSETPPNQMHELPGESAVKATIKLTNLSDESADATYLSFPTLTAGEIVSQAVTPNDGEMFGTIAPGESKELTFYFPVETMPTAVDITLDDGKDATVTITHPLS